MTIIGRRKFISALGSAAVALPLAAHAQQSTMPVIGFLTISEALAQFKAAFRVGLSESGFIEGRNVSIEFRSTRNQYDELPKVLADFVHRQVAVIVTPNSNAAARAAKAATNTIPIIFSVGADPVMNGLVASFNRPGGNATGVSYLTTTLGEKRLGLLHELMPNATRFAVLTNPNSPTSLSATKDVQAAASVIGLQTEVFHASNNREIDSAFASLMQKRVEILLVVPDSLFTSRRVQVVTLASHLGVPAIYTSREFADVGGLMSYGTELSEVYRQLGVYTGRILKGEKPADLPVQQPTKYDFVINLQTARTLGIEIPPTLLARADEVIE